MTTFELIKRIDATRQILVDLRVPQAVQNCADTQLTHDLVTIKDRAASGDVVAQKWLQEQEKV